MLQRHFYTAGLAAYITFDRKSMKCPHCITSFHDNREITELGEDATSNWSLVKRTCPECHKFVFSLFEQYNRFRVSGKNRYHDHRERLCYPKAMSRSPLPPEVPQDFARDYSEACLTLVDSPTASAALSRRCLQHILRERVGVKKGDLASEIQQVLDERKLPTHLLESLDAVRNIGNFAAHPIKSTASGEVLEVAPGEAEWNLDVLEALSIMFLCSPNCCARRGKR